MAAGFLLAAGLLYGPALAEPLTPQEALGKRIYIDGVGTPGGKILALVGDPSVTMPATAIPCANCHGFDGLGRPEGGVVPSNITWSHLTKPYDHRHANGRRHPAFDERSLNEAIADGVDPAGNALDSAMPRYRMSGAERAALIAYLGRIEDDLDPGLTDTAVTVAAVLPGRAQPGSLGHAVAATLQAYFNAVNAGGGVFGRRIDLKLLDRTDLANSAPADVGRLIQRKIFAAVGVFPPGLERQPFSVFESSGIPAIGAFSRLDGTDDVAADSTFFLLSGLPDQARALAKFATQRLASVAPLAGIVLPADKAYRGIAEIIERIVRLKGWSPPKTVIFTGSRIGDARRIDELRRAGAEMLFYFGPPGGLRVVTDEAASARWFPYLFLSGLSADPAIFDIDSGFQHRLFLAYPTLPSDLKKTGAAELREMGRKIPIPAGHALARTIAAATAKVFVEGLRRAGRALSRAKFVAALENLNRFETGLTPIVSFGPNRRVGALGAHIRSVDLKNKSFFPDGKWLAVD